jgi:hypothetical protein
MNSIPRSLKAFTIFFSLNVLLNPGTQAASTPLIVSPENASWMERVAALEVRRYLFVRTGQLLPMVTDRVALRGRSSIYIARKDRAILQDVSGSSAAQTITSLESQSYWLKTISSKPGPNLIIAGGDDAGVLYGAYRFAEQLGIRFYLDGDVIPDERLTSWKLPILDEKGIPLFKTRGIQPFHDFPEGPDWWNREDYLAILGQLPKLGMNFFGLHTYPENRPNAEPTVWIGLPEDIGVAGEVKFSYPASYQNTLRGNWGYSPRKTADWVYGSSQLFERDDFGAEVMFGMIPEPKDPAACNELFQHSGALLNEAFTFAHQLGIKTCVGTETPLVIPKLVQERLKSLGKNPSEAVQRLYEGIYRRAAQTYPLDYYWFWTPEDWTWSGVKEEQLQATKNDFAAAIAAHRAVNPPFALATCGWVLGPQQDRAMFDKILPKSVAVSCINREVGYTPVDPGFAQVQGRSKWAIPWMEDDPALTTPQLWVGRMRRDAADSLRYNCDGLLGIHWRTRVLSMNVGALAQAAWRQEPWIDAYRASQPAKQLLTLGAAGGQVAAFPNNSIADTDEDPIYQTVRYNLSEYNLPLSNGLYTVTLKFCEPHYDAPGKRVFDVSVQGQQVITNLDIFERVGKNRALDFTFEEIPVTNGWIRIQFTPRVEFPSIAGLVLSRPGFVQKLNCGGDAFADYSADISAPTAKPVLPTTDDFYLDWATHQFGKKAGEAAARIFERMDGMLPKPATWVDGPGGVKPDPRQWPLVRKEYAFVDDFAALRPLVKGAGNLERFSYWLNTLLYFRDIGELNCAWADSNSAMDIVKAETQPAEQRRLARELALPAREKLVSIVSKLFEHLLATISNPGELGTVANWNQHNLPGVLVKSGEELAKVLGEPLSVRLNPSKDYTGLPRVFVPTVQTSIEQGQNLQLKVVVLSAKPARSATLFWREMGSNRYQTLPLSDVARGVYSVQVAAPQEDFEYHLEIEPAEGKHLFFPATAPRQNHTVIVTPARR